MSVSRPFVSLSVQAPNSEPTMPSPSCQQQRRVLLQCEMLISSDNFQAVRDLQVLRTLPAVCSFTCVGCHGPAVHVVAIPDDATLPALVIGPQGILDTTSLRKLLSLTLL